MKNLKVKAEQINSFKYVTKENILNYEFRASVSVKIQNKIIPISLKYGIDYRSKDRNNKKIQLFGDELKKFKEFGIDVDYSDIIKKYEKNLHFLRQTRRDQLKIYYTNLYNKSWVHSFIKQINKLPEGVELKLEKIEEYIKRQIDISYSSINVELKMSYKDIQVKISHTCSSNNYSLHSRPNKYEYQFDYKTKWAKKPQTLVDGFKKKVNEYFENERIKKENELKKLNKTENTIKEFESTFHLSCISKKIYHKNYTSTFFYLLIDDKKIAISKAGKNLFYFNDIEGLTKEQILAIIDIIK